MTPARWLGPKDHSRRLPLILAVNPATPLRLSWATPGIIGPSPHASRLRRVQRGRAVIDDCRSEQLSRLAESLKIVLPDRSGMWRREEIGEAFGHQQRSPGQSA